MNYSKNDLVGAGFKFVSYQERKNGRPQAEVICPVCEKPFITDLADVERKKKSCLGCKHKLNKISAFKHGHSRSYLGRKYKSMKDRCYNKKASHYKNYGGRGIKICDEWLEDRTKFFEWALNNGVSADLEIDRVDNDGDYTPSNCRFITREENQKNMRKLQDRRHTKYGFFGVKPVNKSKLWSASFTYKGKTHIAGSASTPREAAVLHDAYVILHKLDRKLNFPTGG